MKALILVDLQIDFCTSGALPVSEAEAILPIANQLMSKFDCIIATQDWHPANHVSFAANHLWRKPYAQIELNGLQQTLWPIHCVQHSFGAEFAPALQSEKFHKIIQKGIDPMIDSYSCFFDTEKKNATELHDYLQAKGIEELFIMGLTTDYSIKFTVLDALSLGYKTNLIMDACRAFELSENDADNAISTLETQGAKLIYAEQVDALL